MRVLALVLAMAGLALSGNFRLYLKDGAYHVVREYKVEEDRVRYYSIERSDWEEIPLDLVDLKKTEAERKRISDAEKERSAIEEAEDKFERELRREINRIPEDPGVYQVQDGKLLTLKLAEVKVATDKKRSILKVLSPIPIVAGKANVELDGAASNYTVADARPSFYFRLSSLERFGIVRLKPGKKDTRLVAVWEIEPMTKQVFFNMELVDVFRQQLRENLYKVWPTKPLSPGEYVFIQYTEGEGMIQVWDFRVAPGTPAAQ